MIPKDLSFNFVEKLAKIPERALSIFVDDSHTQNITAKGKDVFVDIRPNIYTHQINEIRRHLKEIGIGEESELKKALIFLANIGNYLFRSLFPDREVRRKILTALRNYPEDIEKLKLNPLGAKTIHIGHGLNNKVIPWNMIYDRHFDKRVDLGRNLPKSEQKGIEVCLACISEVRNSPLDYFECGKETDKNCLLHPTNVEKRQLEGLPKLTEETVVCPMHFWGFRHIIEIPPQQVYSEKENVVARKSSIEREENIQVVTGINRELDKGGKHYDEIEKWLNRSRVRNLIFHHRDRLLDELKRGDLDFIYLFCHTELKGDTPYLQFSSEPGLIAPVDFLSDDANNWDHFPLVFLNTCTSVSYRPDDISPFINTLVKGRKASGIIGTEIDIEKWIAQKVIEKFLDKFLSGSNAGEALFYVKRALLYECNLLGLIYILLAPADLKFKD